MDTIFSNLLSCQTENENFNQISNNEIHENKMVSKKEAIV